MWYTYLPKAAYERGTRPKEESYNQSRSASGFINISLAIMIRKYACGIHESRPYGIRSTHRLGNYSSVCRRKK
jgi:hypothetical protein